MNKIAIKEKNALAEYEITPFKVAEMAKQYMDLIVPEGCSQSYRIVRTALTTCVRTRTATDKRRKELGEDARKWISDINQAAKELLAPLIPVEKHLKTEIDREDNRKAAIKEKAYQKELVRVEGIQEKITDITSLGSAFLFNLSVASLNEVLAKLETFKIIPDEYMEFTKEANTAKHDVHIALQKAIEAREKFDAEEAERKAEDERLAKERAELEKIKAEQNAIAKAQADKEAEIQAGKDRLEREEFERQAKENAKVQAEKEASIIFQEKLEREAKEKEEREQAWTEELARIKALEPDKSKLGYWLEQIEIAIDEKPEGIGQEAKLLLRNSTTWFDTIVSDIKIGIEDL